MEDQDKSKAQLLNELATIRQQMAALQQQVTDLEAVVSRCKQTEEELRSSQERFYQFVLSISDHIYVTEITKDQERLNRYLSPHIESLTGHSQAAHLADWSLWPYQTIHPDDRAAAAAQAARLAQGCNSEMEYRLVRADGQIIWVRDSARVETVDSSKMVYGVVADITERKHREMALAKLLELSRALVTIHDPTLVLDEAIKLAVNIAPAADRGSLQLLDDDAKTLRTVAISSPDEPIEEIITFRPGEGIAGHALVNNRTINVPDVLEDERFILGRKRLRFRSLLVAPLVVKGRLLGTMSLSSEKIGAFSQADEALVQLIADQIASALENARLFISHVQAEKLRKAHQFLQSIIDALASHIAILDEQGQIIAVNANWRRHAAANRYASPDGDWSMNYLKICRSTRGPYAEAGPAVAEGIRQVMAAESEQFYLEYRVPNSTETQWYGARITRFESEGAIRVVVAHEDITERKTAEEAVRASEEKYRNLTNQLPVGVYRLTKAGEFIYANPALAAILGYDSVNEIMQAPARDVFDDLDEREQQLGQWKNGFEVICNDIKLRTQNGGQIWGRDTARIILNEHGQIDYIDGIIQDITEHKEAEAALQASESRFRSLVQYSSDIITLLDADRTVLYVSSPVERILGYPPEALIGQNVLDYVHPEDLRPVRTRFAYVAHHPGIGRRPIEFRIRHANGAWVWMEAVGNNLLNDPNVRGVVVNARDINNRKRTEEQLRLLAIAIGSTDDGVLITDTQPEPAGPRIVFVNRGLCRMTGYNQEELVGQKPDLFQGLKSDRTILNQLKGELSAGQSFNLETINYRQDGSEYHAAWHISPVLNASDQITHYVSIQRDVTELKLLEAQFLQSQKMEAIGRLAGGVAHDFNNLLTIIKGYSEMLLIKLHPDDPLCLDVEEIKRAGDQAAVLTHRLLIFSRQEMVQPRALDLNSIISDMEKMLRRLIGEDIQLVMALEPSLTPVKADAGQMEQVIMNLVVNARDAMPQGGCLTIETRNVRLDDPYLLQSPSLQSGQYVQLTVSDTGIGIDEQAMVHIFEPFYTTKERGKGTGLGLSTVYAIINQSKGSIQVRSTPGQGTTFTIYLPCLDETDQAVSQRASNGMVRRSEQGTETVLLVEDEKGVRELAKRALRHQGYHILEAEHGDEALQICQAYQGPIHLLLTDVIMPNRMSGRELAEQVKALLPDTKILYMSGYTDDVIVQHGVLDASVNFLQKPFNPSDLLRKVREVLDETNN
jgi:PAS domain S-box-containing protein